MNSSTRNSQTRKRTFALGAMLAMLVNTATAAPVCQWKSPTQPLLVAELFTSEGCNSCPPAERWLSKTLKADALADQILPLAFHVDYWDYIGWKDPYSKPEFTNRQYEWQKSGASQIVYTPEFILSGKEYRGWRNPSALRQALAENATQKAPLEIKATLVSSNSNALAIRLEQQWHGRPEANAQTALFLYEDGLSQQVSAGENRGELLQHDAVVRSTLNVEKLKPNGAATVVNIPLQKDWRANRLGLGVVVSADNGQRVFQALNVPRLLAQCTEQPQN